MPAEAELYYMLRPVVNRPVLPDIDILPVQEFLQDEPACRALWDLLDGQFHTRSKFLAIWPCVRHVVVHRTCDRVDGLLLISTFVNWQIDYVVVRPEARGRGMAAALVDAAISQAFELGVPYIMLTSREGLRPLYEDACGFEVIGRAPAASRPQYHDATAQTE